MTALPQNTLADMLHGSCRPKPGSTAADRTSSADSLQQMAHKLAASKQAKIAAVMWSRALMHQLAAQAHCQDGTSKLGLCTRLSLSPVTMQMVLDLLLLLAGVRRPYPMHAHLQANLQPLLPKKVCSNTYNYLLVLCPGHCLSWFP